jgi:hypothetical protein
VLFRSCGICGIPSIAALVTGILGRNQIKASNGLEKGDGMALAGIITGAIGILMGFGWLIISIAGSGS